MHQLPYLLTSISSSFVSRQLHFTLPIAFKIKKHPNLCPSFARTQSPLYKNSWQNILCLPINYWDIPSELIKLRRHWTESFIAFLFIFPSTTSQGIKYFHLWCWHFHNVQVSAYTFLYTILKIQPVCQAGVRYNALCAPGIFLKSRPKILSSLSKYILQNFNI